MKKLALTMALVLAMGLGAMAQQGGGLLKRGDGVRGDRSDLTTPVIPQFGQTNHQDGSAAPLGSGVAVLLTLGGAYLVAKKRREE